MNMKICTAVLALSLTAHTVMAQQAKRPIYDEAYEACAASGNDVGAIADLRDAGYSLRSTVKHIIDTTGDAELRSIRLKLAAVGYAFPEMPKARWQAIDMKDCLESLLPSPR